MAARVRELIGSIKKDFSPKEISQQLELQDGGAVRHVLRDMLRRREVEQMGYGRYRFIGFSPRWSDRAAVKPRVHRAIHVKKSFTANDIARLSDATVNFVRKELRSLVSNGDIERIGTKANSRFSREWVYRVCHPDRFYLKFCARKSTDDSKGGKDGSHRREGRKKAEAQSDNV
jgi:hypothetical protein